MTTSAQNDPLIGTLVDGRYRVRTRIARGGMATVYVATDMRLERRVALKVMHGHLSDDSVFQSRFIQEARAAARLADPHVVNVFDQGQDGEIAYLVMEYLPGITLRELMGEQKRLSISQTITIMDAVLSGLAAAHRAGIVHRDVKPENVLLAEDGRIKIGDFGLARATTANTATGAQLLGTIAYLAPELVTRGTADARSDIYALGIMLYEMLVGEQPYQGEQPMQIAFQHATEQVPRPSARVPDVPEQIDELVLWSTEKAPDDRPRDAQEMLSRLREIERTLDVAPQSTGTVVAQGQSSTSSTGALTKILPGAGASTTDPLGTTAPQDDEDDNASRLRRRVAARHSRGGWLLAIVLVLAVLAGGAGWWFGSGPGSLVAVPSVEGLSYDDAAAALEAEGFSPSKVEEDSVDVDAGLTIRTEPGAGERLEPESKVGVVISTGPAEHEIPELAGKSEEEVRDILADAKVSVADDVEPYFSDTESDLVINVRVSPRDDDDSFACGDGCTLHEADSAVIQVSAGRFPSIVGKSLDEATTLLEDAGLKVGKQLEEEYSDEIAKGSVIRFADRKGGGTWRPGDSVRMAISKGPQPVDVPDVAGQSLSDAMTTLRDNGLNPTTVVPEGLWSLFRATSTDPAAGTSVERGSEVRVKVSG